MKPSESNEKKRAKIGMPRFDHFQDFLNFSQIFPSLANEDTKDRLKKNKGKRREEGMNSLHNRGFSNFVVRNYLFYPLLEEKKED